MKKIQLFEITFYIKSLQIPLGKNFVLESTKKCSKTFFIQLILNGATVSEFTVPLFFIKLITVSGMG